MVVIQILRAHYAPHEVVLQSLVSNSFFFFKKMFRNKLTSHIFQYKTKPKLYTFFKRSKIYGHCKTSLIVGHRGMLFARVKVTPLMTGFRIGEFVFTRKFFKRPLRLKHKKR